ncbi:MAG: M48 family metalloprotease [Flavobacteriaceae bacterium]|nr:M48 family metalloprotease [Flavobacteriaceae bacterium]
MRGGNTKIRLLIGAAIILFALFRYCSSAEDNPYTGEKQHITLSKEEEIAIGLQAAPEMAAQHGGLYPDESLQRRIDEVGNRLVNNSVAAETGYQYEFHLLADPNTINAFALPGGQIFITYALFSKLQNEDQLAGILGHEIGHVVARHSADRLAKQGLTQGILSGVAVGVDPNTAQGAAAIASLINMKYGREDELQSDDLGVRFMIKAGYDPEAMIGVMEILKEAGGPNRAPEFQSTHPYPENRIEQIRESIEKYRDLM